MPDARIQPEDENRDVTATPQGAGNLSRSLSFLPDPLGTVENYPRDSFIGTVSPKFADQVANPHGDTYTDFLSVTPSVSQANPLGPRRVPYTTDELANIWYYSHLRALPRDAGYIILLTLFTLYERRGRRMAEVKGHSIPTDSKFYDNLATDFGLGSRENALAFWTKFRHGLAHQAAVRGFEDNLRWETILGPHPDGVPPVLVDTVNGIQMFFVDPIKLRDDLLPMMENDKEMWTGETAYPLMEVWQL